MWKRESLKSDHTSLFTETGYLNSIKHTDFQHSAFTLTPNVNNKHVLGALLHNGYQDLDFCDDPQHSRSLKLSALVLPSYTSLFRNRPFRLCLPRPSHITEDLLPFIPRFLHEMSGECKELIKKK